MSKKTIKPVVDVIVDDKVAEVEEIPQAPVAPVKQGSYVCVDGDTYPSVAAKFKPSGMTKHQYANELFVVNGGKPLAAGIVVVL